MEEQLVWHYTSIDGLIGIVSKHELWASSVAFLNDDSELGHARQIVRDAVLALPDEANVDWVTDLLERRLSWEDSAQGFPRRFVACATIAEDGLDLWRGYGPSRIGGTFAVGLDRTVPLACLLDEEDLESEDRMEVVGEWSELDYSESTAVSNSLSKQLREEIADASARADEQRPTADPDDDDPSYLLISEILDRHLAALVASQKHPAFRNEHEVRLTCVMPCGTQYDVRGTADGPVPYVRFTGTGDPQPLGGSAGRVLVRHPSPLPIRRILTWPGAPLAAGQGVAALLEKNGYNHNLSHAFTGGLPHVRIEKSKVPYRG